jgi:hypothetical protein
VGNVPAQPSLTVRPLLGHTPLHRRRLPGNCSATWMAKKVSFHLRSLEWESMLSCETPTHTHVKQGALSYVDIPTSTHTHRTPKLPTPICLLDRLPTTRLFARTAHRSSSHRSDGSRAPTIQPGVRRAQTEVQQPRHSVGCCSFHCEWLESRSLLFIVHSSPRPFSLGLLIKGCVPTNAIFPSALSALRWSKVEQTVRALAPISLHTRRTTRVGMSRRSDAALRPSSPSDPLEDATVS